MPLNYKLEFPRISRDFADLGGSVVPLNVLFNIMSFALICRRFLSYGLHTRIAVGRIYLSVS